MARKHVRKRVTVVLLALCLGTPLLMGQGCCEGLWLLGLLGAGQMGGARCPTLLDPLTVDAGNDLTVTLGGNVEFGASASGGTAPYTIAWSPATGLSNTGVLAPVFTPVSEGQFTFTITVTDAVGCAISDSLVVAVSDDDSDSGHGIGGGDDDGDDGGTDADGDNGDSGQPGPLVVDAGPDRAATVGASMVLQGSFSGGSGPFTISWSPAGGLLGSNTLTPTFTPTSAGDITFTLTVTDGTGASEHDSMVISVSTMTSLSRLAWGANFAGESYQLLAEFSKAVDKASAERLTNYCISGTETNPVSAVLSSDTRTVVLVFADVKLTAKTEFDISIGTGVLDTNGVRIMQVKGLVPVSNPEDTTAPTVAMVRWAVNYNGSYGVELAFSEAMDQSLVESARTYEIEDNGVSAVAFDAVMGTDGKTVNLVFHGMPLSQAATISIGLLTIRDINGQKLQRVDGKPIAANSYDLDPPLVVNGSVQFVVDYAAGGYQVVLDLNEAMDRVSVEDPTAYLIDGLAASSAKLGNEGRHVTLTCASSTYSPDSKLSILGNRVKDINGRYLAAQTNLAILPASSSGSVPSVPVLTWLKGSESTGYQFLARFNDSMNSVTVQDTKNWRISGTSIRPTAVVLSTQTVGEEIAGRTAKVTFGDFGASGIPMSRTSKVDVSVGDSITDINGQKLTQVSCAIGAHPGDTTAPSVTMPRSGLIARPVWGDVFSPDSYQGDAYVLSLAFTETMDAGSAMDPTNYYLAGVHPTSLVLDPTGRKLVLTFASTPTGIMAADKLQILGNVRDINGRRTSSVVPLSIQALPDDTMPPGINDMFWGINRGPYEVAITFDEVMDAESAANVAAYTIDGLNPTAAAVQPDGKTVVLVFGDSVLHPLLELSLVGTVKDLNGNAYDGSHGEVSLPVAPNVRPENDQEPAELASAVWAADSLDYRVLATFTESLDFRAAETLACYNCDADSGRFESTSATLMPGGITVETVFTDFGAWMPGVLPPTPLNKTAQLNVVRALTGSVLDMHGWPSRTSTTIGANPLDTAAVELLIPDAMWAANFNEGGYRLTVTFAAEVLDASSAESTNNYSISRTYINPTDVRLSGLDDLPRGVYAGRTSFLTFTTKPMSITTTIDASVGGSITDMSGNSMPQVSGLAINSNPEDTTPPEALTAQSGFLLGQVVVSFSEAMDETSVELLSNYTLLIDPTDPATTYTPYAASLGNDGMTVYLQFEVLIKTGMALGVMGAQDINGQVMTNTELPL